MLVVAVFSSCNFTDPEALTFKSKDQVIKNMNDITNLLNNVYSNLPYGYNSIGSSSLAAACDEAEEVNDVESIQNFNIGNWGPYSNPEGNPWSNNYAGIYKANAFLELIKQVDWSTMQIADPTEYTRRSVLMTMHTNEARFLRAYYYFDLIKRYGGVPLVNRTYNPNTELDSLKTMSRSNFADCVNFIVDECDTAAKYLDPSYTNIAYYGRVTKGAALALKARTLVYAASDLFNQVTNSNPILGYTDAASRKDRWIRAAKACKAVWEVKTGAALTYDFHSSYSDLFLLKAAVSKEVIFERRNYANNAFESTNYPVGLPAASAGKTSTCPSQNLVDAYQMANGKEITDPTSIPLYNPLDPYSNRDPRLKKTVVVNNSTFGIGNNTVELWEGGASGIPRKLASKTGYYLRKYVDEKLDLTQSSGISAKQWIYFRLSDIYLYYAECMVSAYGVPSAVSVADGFDLSAVAALNKVRTRAAVAMPAYSTSITTADFITAIKKERQVELAFEDSRYWDVRRWMIAENTIGGNLNGMSIQKSTTGSFIFNSKIVETRVWDKKMYLYPIPQSEINKTPIISQNPSW